MTDLRKAQATTPKTASKNGNIFAAGRPALGIKDLQLMIKASRTYSKATIKRYESVIKRLTQGQLHITKNKSSWYAQRAALRYHAVLSLTRVLGDGAMRDIENNTQVLPDPRTVIELHFRALEAYDRTKPSQFLKGKSKGKQLKNLSKDWIDKLLVHGKTVALAKHHEPDSRWSAATDGTCIRALAISAATGCRPAEIARGAVVNRMPNGEIYITISGAKGRKAPGLPSDFGALAPHDKSRFLADRGRGIRTYIVKAGSIGCTPEVVKTIGNMLAKADKQEVKISADAYRKWMARRTKQLGIKASPYAVRHAYASDLKANVDDKGLIAGGMGHAGINSQTAYGRGNLGVRSPGKESNLVSAEGNCRGTYKAVSVSKGVSKAAQAVSTQVPDGR